jgi:hypothetical protein
MPLPPLEGACSFSPFSMTQPAGQFVVPDVLQRTVAEALLAPMNAIKAAAATAVEPSALMCVMVIPLF